MGNLFLFLKDKISSMSIQLFKSLHVIGFVAWFAGLFYLVRLFVYHREAFDREDHEQKVLHSQYSIMERRLYHIITQPAMILTWAAGIAMLIINPAYLSMGWMHLKLTLLIGLTIYHFSLSRMMGRLQASTVTMTSFQFRLYNEVPTILLIGIVLLAVYKSLIDMLAVFGVLIAVSILLFLFARWYKKKRSNSNR